jgi:hypothetical protein
MRLCSQNYEATLGVVRELSENATLRPSPFVLRCIPFQEYKKLQPLTPRQKFWRNFEARLGELGKC